MKRSTRWIGVIAWFAVAAASPAARAGYLAGGDVESINPTPEMIASGNFFLGGYGFGSGRVANQQALQTPLIDPRLATGVMPCPPSLPGCDVHSRAVAFSDGTNTIVFAQVETQGYFVAYKVGPVGLSDIRRDAAASIAALPGYATSPKISAGSILVDSNHTHGGPDTVGVWGGVPTSYLQEVHDQTVKAIVEAYQAMRPAELWYGAVVADGSDGEDNLLANQFGYDPANQSLDNEVRVIQARDPGTHQPFLTYSNFSAHPTVLGSGNRLVTSDYTGPLSEMIAAKYTGIGFDQVATLGRTQPNRESCVGPLLPGETDDICHLRTYATRVLAKVDEAVTSAKQLDGAVASVDLHSYLMEDPATNALLYALSYGGVAAGVPILRSVTPPWLIGPLLGAPSFSGHIGNILIVGGPGEMYPQIVRTIREIVQPAGQLNIGTAGDFLGYIIAPLGAYPEPIRRSILSGDPHDPTTWQVSPVDNDNYFFNISHTFGERLICSLLRGSGETLAGTPQKYWLQYDLCPAFVNDFILPADADTLAPAPPDLSAVPGLGQ